jgi:hypothetical protein
MVQLALKKKESRLLWEILVRGIVATDQANRRKPSPDQDAYRHLRSKVLRAWKSGVIVGGVRPKRRIHDILPDHLLKESELAVLEKAHRRAKAKAKRVVAAPSKRRAAAPSDGDSSDRS